MKGRLLKLGQIARLPTYQASRGMIGRAILERDGELLIHATVRTQQTTHLLILVTKDSWAYDKLKGAKVMLGDITIGVLDNLCLLSKTVPYPITWLLDQRCQISSHGKSVRLIATM